MRHRRRWLALLLLMMLAPFPLGAAQPSPLDELMQRLASVPERAGDLRGGKDLRRAHANTPQQRHAPLRRPSHLEKITYPPHPKSLVVDDGRLVVIVGDEPPRSVDLESRPELGALVDAVRGTLAGDLTALRRNYKVRCKGTSPSGGSRLRPRTSGSRAFCAGGNRGRGHRGAFGADRAGERRSVAHDANPRPALERGHALSRSAPRRTRGSRRSLSRLPGRRSSSRWPSRASTSAPT